MNTKKRKFEEDRSFSTHRMLLNNEELLKLNKLKQYYEEKLSPIFPVKDLLEKDIVGIISDLDRCSKLENEVKIKCDELFHSKMILLKLRNEIEKQNSEEKNPKRERKNMDSIKKYSQGTIERWHNYETGGDSSLDGNFDPFNLTSFNDFFGRLNVRYRLAYICSLALKKEACKLFISQIDDKYLVLLEEEFREDFLVLLFINTKFYSTQNFKIPIKKYSPKKKENLVVTYRKENSSQARSTRASWLFPFHLLKIISLIFNWGNQVDESDQEKLISLAEILDCISKEMATRFLNPKESKRIEKNEEKRIEIERKTHLRQLSLELHKKLMERGKEEKYSPWLLVNQNTNITNN